MLPASVAAGEKGQLWIQATVLLRDMQRSRRPHLQKMVSIFMFRKLAKRKKKLFLWESKRGPKHQYKHWRKNSGTYLFFVVTLLGEEE